MTTKNKQFHLGDKVSFYSRVLTVVRQRGEKVFVKEDPGCWYHIKNLTQVYQTFGRDGKVIWVTIPE